MAGDANEIGQMATGLPRKVELSRIKADLPNWPDDVIAQWLLKVANRGPETGWPPPDPLAEPWKYVLGERPLSWWNAVTWRLEEHELDINRLSASTQRAVRDMIAAHVDGVPNIYTRLPESKQRFTSALQHITQHGTIPKPPLAMRVQDGFVVIDGNHRLAALCFRQGEAAEGGIAPLKAHKLWVGTQAPPAG
jgi:hypothetical protein